MNIEHLKYFIALAERRNFSEAAKFCNISQPALSQAIQRIENTLNTNLVNRTKSPISLTEKGQVFYHKMKKLLFEYEQILNEVHENEVQETHLRIGIIPTLSTYLLPLFLGEFAKEHPNIHIHLEDLKTEDIISKIKKDELDAGLLATPIEVKSLEEEALFFEEFLVYHKTRQKKKFILPKDLDTNQLWILEEGHCLRNQILHLCELKRDFNQLKYKAGSIETLINLVDAYHGATIVPELATLKLSKARKEKLSSFKAPVPGREIGLVYHKFSVKKTSFQFLKDSIIKSIPKYMHSKKRAVHVLKID